MKVAVVGTRTRRGISVEKLIQFLPKNCSMILSGGAQGVDAAAQRAAKALNLPFRAYLPDYGRFGARAPLARNETIAQNCNYLLAFWDFQSHGTRHILSLCISEGIPFRIIPLDAILIPAGAKTNRTAARK